MSAIHREIEIEARPLLPDSDKSSKRRRVVAAFITIGVVLTLCITIGVIVSPASKNANEPDKGPVLKSVSTHAATQCPTGTYDLDVGSVSRKFEVYTPATATSNSAMVFVWHGIASSPSKIEAKIQMNAQADKYGWVVVHPYGIGLMSAFNGRGCCDSKPNDVDFAYGMINYLSELKCASADKVYTSGFSNGGFMGHELGCRQDGTSGIPQYKAIASHSGLIAEYTETLPTWTEYTKCNFNAANPPAFISMHGTKDNVVNINGRSGRAGVYSHVDAMNIWRKKHNCDASKDIEEQVTSNSVCISNSECAVVRCTVTGLGHDWSGFKGSTDLPATETIAAFFIKHGANN